ncbi:MAG: polyprenyl synthetase family protein [Actinomycetales bacterium]
MSSETGTGAPGVLAEQEHYVRAVARSLGGFLDSKTGMMAGISPDALALLDSIRSLVTGGKRLRAMMCYWGWRGAGGAEHAPRIIAAGTALELFQAAALIHDDIIDRSDTRRGAPSVHRQFSALHAERNWALDPERFGTAAAILTGDLCLSFSEEVFAGTAASEPRDGRARSVFDTMRAEVMAGQYLDILEEVAGPSRDRSGAVARAGAIIRYKSAKYSMEHPLVLGGALAGGSDALLAAYSAFAIPLGEAFQLRDDVLGVFGDPAETGKPAGDDLREGKRTVLVGLALEKASEADARFVDQRLGSAELSGADISRIRAILADSGALASTEAMIGELSAAAFSALAELDLESHSASALHALATAAVTRRA